VTVSKRFISKSRATEGQRSRIGHANCRARGFAINVKRLRTVANLGTMAEKESLAARLKFKRLFAGK
jgi:hypothetical protein